MVPTVEELVRAIARDVPGSAVSAEGPRLRVPAGDLLSVCRYLQSHPDYAMDYLSNLTAADYPPERLQMVYHLYSMAKKHGPVALCVDLPRSEPVIASVTPVWRGAEFQEREVYDLLGVRFEGHPDLRRILLWDGFDGYPLRKDYVMEDQDAPLAP